MAPGGVIAVGIGGSMGAIAQRRFSFEAYVALERESTVKHEFLDGQVVAMAGGSPQHAATAARLARLFGNALVGRRCAVYTADLRVRVLATGLTTYPDLTVVCDHLETDPGDPHTAINPVGLVEVLSPSTEAYDRGEKLEHYKQIPSLSEILLVAHDARRLELWTREPGATSWSLTLASEGETLTLATLGVQLSVAEVFDTPF